MLDDSKAFVRDAAFCVAPSSKEFLLRTDRWADIQYAEDASEGIELFDMHRDPRQFTNLAKDPAHADTVATFRLALTKRLKEMPRP